MEVTLSAPDLAQLGPRWRALEDRADPSFFMSWSWVGCQVESRFDRPVLLAGRSEGVDVALALFNRRAGALWLHETGDPALDAPFIERNGIMIARGHELQLPELVRALPGRLVLSGISDSLAQVVLRRDTAFVSQRRPAPVLDLSDAPLQRASANTRAQIRRSMRRYEIAGPLALVRGDTVPQALAWLHELAEWHAVTWRARGQPGAFADERTLAFHHELLARGVPRGEIDLLRITAGTELVGLLYNVRRNGRVYAYQSGFVYDSSRPHLKPGLTCHTLAAAWYGARGAATYDFLGGADRYKRSLATQEDSLYWLRLAPRWSPIGIAARIRRHFPGASKRPSSEPSPRRGESA